MTWFERALDRVRSINQLLIDGCLAGFFVAVGLATVLTQTVEHGLAEPGSLAVLAVVLTCAPIVARRRAPLAALLVADLGIVIHIELEYPEGSLPVTLLFLTYTAAAWCSTRRAVLALVVVLTSIAGLAISDVPGLDALGALANIAFFGVAWATGFAMRARRDSLEARLREVDERANVERQHAARVLAEERLRIAQELHDVVAHSMSVIAVQAGVGAHVLHDRPDQARAALEAISATSRGTLAEMRRLLGVLRDGDGERANAPAPVLADLARLVDDVGAVGVPVSLTVTGSSESINPAVELSAYRVVQEALTNVIKHAGTPTRVAVDLAYLPGALSIEVVDDGRGVTGNGVGPGHGLIGMRERVEVWGGQLTTGPMSGGGFRVKALLPYGDAI